MDRTPSIKTDLQLNVNLSVRQETDLGLSTRNSLLSQYFDRQVCRIKSSFLSFRFFPSGNDTWLHVLTMSNENASKSPSSFATLSEANLRCCFPLESTDLKEIVINSPRVATSD